MECEMAAHLMMILEKSSLHEEFHEVDQYKSKPVGTSGLWEAIAGTRETTLGGGCKSSSNIGWNRISQSFFVVGTYGVEEGGYGTSPELSVPEVIS
ncbi:hypothetical protein Tco_0057262 [Tanacetum coccineum]